MTQRKILTQSEIETKDAKSKAQSGRSGMIGYEIMRQGSWERDRTCHTDWQNISVLHSTFAADISPHDVFTTTHAFDPWSSVTRRVDADKLSQGIFDVHVHKD